MNWIRIHRGEYQVRVPWDLLRHGGMFVFAYLVGGFILKDFNTIVCGIGQAFVTALLLPLMFDCDDGPEGSQTKGYAFFERAWPFMTKLAFLMAVFALARALLIRQ